VGTYVDFINLYNTVDSDHENIFDEYISEKNNQYSINIKTKVEDSLLNIYAQEFVPNIIITGNAGDGKTRLCRKVIEKYFGGFCNWDKEEYDFGSFKLIVIKDLSELSDEKIVSNLKRLQNIINSKDQSVRYLIAANEGKLTRVLNESNELSSLRDQISKMFDEEDSNNAELKLLNLNKVTTYKLVKAVIEEFVKESNWDSCGGNCINHGKCVIRFNRDRLRLEKVQNSLELLYKILEYQGIHVTIRDMLIHISYMLTGGLKCDEINSAEQVQQYAYYENCFATNASSEFREKSWVIYNISKFNIGEKSNFNIDDIIINGELRSNEQEIFDIYNSIFSESEQDMLSFNKQKSLFLHSIDESNNKEFIERVLPRCRRKMFFETDKYSELIHLKFLNQYEQLLTNTSLKFRNQILSSLIWGLNNSLSGLLINKSDMLYLTINFAGPERISDPLVVRKISSDNIKVRVFEDSENYREIDHYKPIIQLVIKEGEDEEVRLSIDYLMFEYLMRLSEGGAQNVLKEYNKTRLIAFKEKLITQKSTSKSLTYLKLKDEGYSLVKIVAEDGIVECI
jgi:hypothetical protein